MKYSHITDEWHLASNSADSALRLLKLGSEDEGKFRSIQSQLKNITNDDPKYGRLKHLHQLEKSRTHLKNMFNFYTVSVMSFQTMMEGVINFEIRKQVEETELKFVTTKILRNKKITSWKKLLKSGNFSIKWETYLQILDQPKCNFRKYHDQIYRRCRISLVHPSKEGISNLECLHFHHIYDGFESGWNALSALYEGLNIEGRDDWNIRVRSYELNKINF